MGRFELSHGMPGRLENQITFTAILRIIDGSIFRLSVYHNYTLNLHREIYSSLEQTYPHSVVLAHTMIGRKSYYIAVRAILA